MAAVDNSRGRGAARWLALALGTIGLSGGAPARAAEDALISPQVCSARDRVFPAVVRIDVHTRTYAEGEKEIVRGTGSGVIIDAAGHILTNYHVAGRAERLIVTLVNKERVRARLIGADHWTDLAVIRVDLDEVKHKHATLTPAALGDSARVVVGEPVLAIGTPFGLSRTMSAGIITNNERYFSGETIDGYETGEFNNWLQTDAAINPGNSGGPLVNLRGEVIGINTRVVELAEGLGFAVPIDVAKDVVRRILADQHVARGYCGLRFRELQDLETHFGLEANRGVLIESVDPRSPAEAADVRPEDVLIAVDGVEVSARFPEELPAVRRMLADRPVGSEVALRIKRGDTLIDARAKTTPLESEMAEDEREFERQG
ncbi:MAG: trypsin-like peptidase domain-containing protein [Phycisphaerae bacterium]